MIFSDALTCDRAARICADGALVAEVFAARTGIQDYTGREVDPQNVHGLRDKATVKVYRPESEVFKADSLATFAAAPVTVNHPSEAVTADNWRGLGVGEINGDVVRDGQRVRVPIIIRDAAAVRAAQTTHKQLSMGYATELVFPADGKHPDGTACDAYQSNIRINHIALVPAARGGPELRVVDERPAPFHEKETAQMKKIVLDGLQVDLTDADAVAAAFDKLQTKAADAAKALTDAQAEISTANGKIAALEQQLADAKAAIEPAALNKLIADRAKILDMAKKMAPEEDFDGEDEMGMKRKAVKKKMGDAAAAMSDAEIAGAFTVLAATAADSKPALHNIAPATIVANDAKGTISALRAARYS